MGLSVLRSSTSKGLFVTFFISKLVGILKLAYPVNLKEVRWSHSDVLLLKNLPV